MLKIKALVGDITTQTTDAVVNAANSDLTGGSGVNGAIHHAAGSALPEALRRIGGCHTGDAVITPGFEMKCRYIIHAVGPVWHGGGLGEEALLTRCYRACLDLATKYELSSIAFPSISTGVYGYPPHLAVPVAVRTVKEHAKIPLVRFVAFDNLMYELFLKEIG
ncbi:MAG: macro domain-containing protein [Gammaproteobacteria bacterium]|nr:macro domain-containing protein [Gammaproteobacteria bacterium]